MISVSAPNRPRSGIGEWMTFPDPIAGDGWEVTVPSGEAWFVHGGGCLLDTSSAAGVRTPGVVATVLGTVVWAHFNVVNNTNAGPGLNALKWIAYNEHRAVMPSTLVVDPNYTAGLPPIWLPAGSTLEGRFQGMDAGDQVSSLGLLVESVPF